MENWLTQVHLKLKVAVHTGDCSVNLYSGTPVSFDLIVSIVVILSSILPSIFHGIFVCDL